MTDMTRDHRGRASRTPAQIESDHQAAQWKSQGLTYQQIGDRLGITRQAAHVAVQRALADIPRMATEELRTLELEKLENLERRLIYIINQQSYKTSASGRVIEYEGKPVLDTTPQIQAIGAALKVIDKRAKLLGLDAPTKVETEITVYDGTGEVERELYERALAWRQWQIDNGGASDRAALPLAGQGETGAEATD
jgi:hypothetical protein